MLRRWTCSAGGFWPGTIGVAVALALIMSSPVAGQGQSQGQVRPGRRSVGARRPSLSGPSTAITRNFGQIARTLNEDWGGVGGVLSRWSPDRRLQVGGTLRAGRSTGLTETGGGGRRRLGTARQGAARDDRGSVGVRGSLLGDRGRWPGSATTGLARSPFGLGGRLTGPSALTRMHTAATSGGPLGLGQARVRRLSDVEYQGWVQPEIAIKARTLHAPASAGPVPGMAPLETKLPLEDLARNYVRARREAFMAQGWQLFKEGAYREAYGVFSLADAVSLDDLQARASVKLAMLFAGIASQKYAQALNTLRWLLTPDSRTGRLPDPLFLGRISDVRSLYGFEENEPSPYGVGAASPYTGHVSALELFAIRNPDSVEAKVLYAFALWQDKADANARGNALFRARQIASDPEAGQPWRNLYQLMQNADTIDRGGAAGYGAGSTLSEPASSLLPFEARVTE